MVDVALNTKKVAMGITISAFSRLFLEHTVAHVLPLLNLCFEAQITELSNVAKWFASITGVTQLLKTLQRAPCRSNGNNLIWQGMARNGLMLVSIWKHQLWYNNLYLGSLEAV
ncbi:hypothetical protein YC2023_107121 [Brassica napus]